MSLQTQNLNGIVETITKEVTSALHKNLNEVIENERTINNCLMKLPKVSIEFNYEIYNSENTLITTAYSKLVFVDVKTRLPIRCPQKFLDKLQN